MSVAGAARAFTVPEDLEATLPPERRGIPRDGVRLLVVSSTSAISHRFRDLPELLHAGDLVVINTSATLPAALDGRHDDGRPARVHVASQLDDGSWVVELRRPDGSGPEAAVHPGVRVAVRGGARLTVADSYPHANSARSRLWRAVIEPRSSTVEYLGAHGRPIRYGYQRTELPLDDYQNVYAEQPGSAEMASAGRPFTTGLLERLRARGIGIARLVLHAGVSSPELHEPPAPERFAVPEATARLVGTTRSAGGRVVAIGTTVVRALESAVDADGGVTAGAGWTTLVLGRDRPARVVDGLVTGLHLPESSHLALLEAVAGRALVDSAYATAMRERYLWHEFGDSMLFLP